MFELPIILPQILFASAVLSMILHLSLNVNKNDSAQEVSTKLLAGHRLIGWLAICVFIIYWGWNELDYSIIKTNPGILTFTHGFLVGMCSISVVPKIFSALKEYKWDENQKKIWTAAVLIIGAIFFTTTFMQVFLQLGQFVIQVDIFYWVNSQIGRFVHVGLALSLIWMGRFALNKRKKSKKFH